MDDLTYPLFPTFSLLGFFLVVIPLPWHMKAWNSGTCFYILWTALACLNQFINSVVWHGNAINWAPVWCDISIRIMMGASVGVPASSLCINRQLYRIMTSSTTSISPNEKKRRCIIDSLICVLLPLIYIALQYVVQGHRFNIYEDIGCFPALYNTLPLYFVSLSWPLIIGCISTSYCVLTLRAIVLRRLEFTRILSAHPSITPWRYFRLMALATSDLLFTMPLAAFVIWLNVTTTPIEPWRGWADTHFDFSRVNQYPALFWRRDPKIVASMEFTRWLVPACALIFFAFFGVADEARRNYVVVFKTLRTFVCSVYFSRISRTRTEEFSVALSQARHELRVKGNERFSDRVASRCGSFRRSPTSISSSNPSFFYEETRSVGVTQISSLGPCFDGVTIGGFRTPPILMPACSPDTAGARGYP
ncbi:hypothetical protein NP233_g5865 [Leucocoprinus birnbaumii]|uniref:Pheromone receptor n=1 Tax=Leucocoprinus birnbaumii TaxID=56174 RepID=A0AAD5VUR6_9AGAR|nr:hypothetical protein NP233_g5865 [Leucocoprinus birnbaumii]